MILSSYKGKNAAENLKAIIDQGFAELQAEHDKLLKQAQNEITPVQEIQWANPISKDYTFYANDYVKRVENELTDHSRWSSGQKPPIERVELAVKTWAEGCKTRGEAIHQTNLPKIASNKALIEKVTFLMQSIGIKPTYSRKVEVKPRARYHYDRYKSVNTNAGYVDDLARDVKIDDGYERMQAHYTELLAALTKYANERRDAEAKIKRDEEAKIKKVEADRALGIYLGKYGLDVKSSWNDVLDAALDKNKYLRLAHYLAKNRADWNDGYSYAEAGLSGFTVETDQDAEIQDEISDLIENWDGDGDGDGRCFRDTKWNYDAIFALVSSDLMTEYNDIKSKMPGEY